MKLDSVLTRVHCGHSDIQSTSLYNRIKVPFFTTLQKGHEPTTGHTWWIQNAFYVMLSWFDVTLPKVCFARDQEPRISLCIIDWGCPYIWISLRVFESTVAVWLAQFPLWWNLFHHCYSGGTPQKNRFRLSSHYTPSTSTGIRDWDTHRYIQINVWPVKSWLSKAWYCTLWLLAAEFISSPFVSCFMTCFVQAVQVICAMIWVLQSKLRIAVFAILNVVNASDCVFVCVCDCCRYFWCTLLDFPLWAQICDIERTWDEHRPTMCACVSINGSR